MKAFVMREVGHAGFTDSWSVRQWASLVRWDAR